MESTGFWGSMHATGAGCASIFAWEAAHTLLTGGLALVFFGGLGLLVMHVAHHHHRVTLQRGTTAPATDTPKA